MARKNVPLKIRIPSVKEKFEYVTTANASGDNWVIPFRYPFADILNYNDLVNDGYFRHNTTTVSTDLGGNATANSKTNLGFQLPMTEKLILLVETNDVANANGNVTLTIEGSTQYGVTDHTYTWATTEDGIFEIDLYDFGLLIGGSSSYPGEIALSITSDTNSETNAGADYAGDVAKLQLALIARMG